MVHFGILEQPNLLPASSHQESPGWFLYASSSCFLPCTSSHTSLFAHTNTPKALKISLRLWPEGAHGYMSKPHFVFSSWKQRGLKAKLKTHGTFHLYWAAREEGRPRFGEGGGVLKHLVSVWQRQGNCCDWTAKHGIYGCVCVFFHLGKLQVLTTWIVFLYIAIIPSSCDRISLTFFSFYRQRDATLLDCFMFQTVGHHKQKPSDNNKHLL